MNDLSALGLPSVQTSHHGGKNHKSGAAHGGAKDGETFGDLIGGAGKKNARKLALADKEDQAAHAVKPHPEKNQTLHVTAKNAGKHVVAAADELDALDDFGDADFADGDVTDAGETAEADERSLVPDTNEDAEAQGRVRLSKGIRQLMKTGAQGGVPGEQGAVEARTGKTQDGKSRDAEISDKPAAKETSKASPSAELHALLGMKADNADDLATADAGADDARRTEIDERSEKPSARHAGHDTGEKAAEAGNAKPQHAAEAIGIAADTGYRAASAHTVLAQAIASTPVSSDADDKKTSSGNENAKVPLVSGAGKSRTADVDMQKVADNGKGKPASAGGDVDFVSVVESRRYLGFSGDGNAAALTSAIKADPTWTQALHDAAGRASPTATEVNTLKLQMNPEHLGNMTASLRLKGEELSVEVRVETVEAYRKLSNDQDSIVKALQDQGFSIDQVSIQLSPSARSDSGQGSSQNQSGNAGQNLQQGGQGDNARQRDESARRNANQNNWTENGKTSSFGNSGSSPDASRAGNIYL